MTGYRVTTEAGPLTVDPGADGMWHISLSALPAAIGGAGGDTIISPCSTGAPRQDEADVFLSHEGLLSGNAARTTTKTKVACEAKGIGLNALCTRVALAPGFATYVRWQACAEHHMSGPVTVQSTFKDEVTGIRDQQNWRDTTCKTCFRPLALAPPLQMDKGSPIKHSMQIRLHADSPSRRDPKRPDVVDGKVPEILLVGEPQELDPPAVDCDGRVIRIDGARPWDGDTLEALKPWQSRHRPCGGYGIGIRDAGSFSRYLRICQRSYGGPSAT